MMALPARGPAADIRYGLTTTYRVVMASIGGGVWPAVERFLVRP